MIIADRQSLWPKQKETPLPDWDYRVEYLQSPQYTQGVPYIDTGIIPTTGALFYLDWEPTDTLSRDIHYHGICYCCGTSIYRSCYRIQGWATEAFNCWEGRKGPGQVWPPAILIGTDTHTIFQQDATHLTIWSVSNNRLLCDYPVICYNAGWADTIRLFKLYNGNESLTSYAGSSKIWEFKYEVPDGSFKMHLVPCVKNGIPCMADLITRQFFYNQGTGSFIAGPIIID